MQEELDDSAAVVLEFGYLCGHNAQKHQDAVVWSLRAVDAEPEKAAHREKSVPFFGCRDFELGRKFPLLEID